VTTTQRRQAETSLSQDRIVTVYGNDLQQQQQQQQLQQQWLG